MEAIHAISDSAGWGPKKVRFPSIPGIDPTDDTSRLSSFVDFGQKIQRREDEADEFSIVDSKLQSQPKLMGKFLQQKTIAGVKQRTVQVSTKTVPTVQRPVGKRTYREQTIAIRSSWNLIAELSKPNNDKLSYEPSKPEDVGERGLLATYKKSQDSQVTTSNPKVLNSKQVELKSQNFTTASSDPLFSTFRGSANVFITDTVLVTLMTMNRSVYPWDIQITKQAGLITFDKPEDSVIDHLTMNENNPEHMPDEEEPETSPNNPKRLSEEAQRVNRSFFLSSIGEPTTNLGPTGFEENTPGVLKFKKWIIGDYQILVRTEIDAQFEENGVKVPTRLFAVNEYDNNITGGYADKLETRRGFIFSNEIKNNSCKMSKWALKAHLAGVEYVKIGYATRINPTSPDRHHLLAVQKIRTGDLMQNLNLVYSNCWGVFKAVLDTIKNQPDGKFVVVKDPLKPVVRIYYAVEEQEENFGEFDGQ
jgi:translation initiation factor 3 subunit D